MREGGTDPQFDHTGKRLYFRERRDEKYVLASVDAVGRRTNEVHFRSDNATQIVPSPDGKWVAFAERYHAFVAAFPRSGRPVDLGPKVVGYPVARISRDAGHVPALVRRQHARATGRSGRSSSRATSSRPSRSSTAAREKPDEPEAKGVPIGFTRRRDVPDGAVALVGARIVTMRGAGRRRPTTASSRTARS